MNVNRTLVIGATGNVGRCVVRQLAADGAQVRALTRNPGAARFPAEVEPVRGDITVPDSLDAALNDVDRVFLVWTAPPDAFPAALERIVRQARRIVFLSAPLKTPHPFFQQPNPIRKATETIERLIEDSGLEWTFLRPGMLASNALLWWAPQIREGNLVRWPYLSASTAPIDERDIAAVAVRALYEDGHERAEYVLTGPQPLTQFDQVSTIGDVIGRSLRIEEMSPEEARHHCLPAVPRFIVDMLLGAWSAALGQPAFVTSTVAEVTGTPARTFRNWAADHVSEFR